MTVHLIIFRLTGIYQDHEAKWHEAMQLNYVVLIRLDMRLSMLKFSNIRFGKENQILSYLVMNFKLSEVKDVFQTVTNIKTRREDAE